MTDEASIETDTLPAEHFASLRDLEDFYWWHQTRYRLAHALLRRYVKPLRNLAVADIGCGMGGLLRYLQQRDIGRAVGFDFSETALRFLNESGITAHSANLEEEFSLAGAPYDVIVALDVMEHITNEGRFLKSVQNNLCAKGFLILTVPAHQFLFSEWDRRLHHFRRYSRGRLATALDEAGFRPIEISHFFSFVVPMALLRRWLGRYDGTTACEFPPVRAPLNRTLLGLGRLELGLLRYVRLPLGTSAYAIAQRRD